jgi:hypothetical protein
MARGFLARMILGPEDPFGTKRRAKDPALLPAPQAVEQAAPIRPYVEPDALDLGDLAGYEAPVPAPRAVASAPRAVASASALEPVRPARRGEAAPLPAPSPAPGIIRVPVPPKDLGGHPWRALRPAGLTPAYLRLDDARVEELLAAVDERRDDLGGILERISPLSIEEFRTHYAMGNHLYSTMVFKEFPTIEEGWRMPALWYGLYSAIDEFSIGVHYWRKGASTAERKLVGEIDKRKILRDETVRGNGGSRKIAIIDEEIEALRAQLKSVIRGADTQFDVSAYLRLSAADEPSLRERAREISELFRTAKLGRTTLMEIPGEQRDAFLSSMPYGMDPLYLARMRGTRRAAELFPFVTRPHSDIDAKRRPTGVLYGVHMYNRTPVLMSPWNADETIDITAVLGAPGAGKSYWLRTHINRMAMTGTRILMIDPIGDYVRWFANNDGQVVEISAESTSHVNPIALAWDQKIGRHESPGSKIDQLKPLFRRLLGTSFTNEALRLVTAALDRFYLSFDPGKEEPLMRDFLLNHLKTIDDLGGEKIGTLGAERDRIYNLLWTTTQVGDLAPFFTHKTNVDLTSPRICFNLAPAGKGEHLTYAAYMAVTLAIKAAKSSVQRKLIAIDEIHLLLDVGRTMARDAFGDLIGNQLALLTREHRHYNTGLTLATQFFDDDDEKNRAQKSILTSVKLWVLMGGTETMLKAAAEAVGEGADADLITSLLAQTEDARDRRGARPAIIYRRGRGLPVYTIGLQIEEQDDDRYSGVRAHVAGGK